MLSLVGLEKEGVGVGKGRGRGAIVLSELLVVLPLFRSCLWLFVLARFYYVLVVPAHQMWGICVIFDYMNS